MDKKIKAFEYILNRIIKWGEESVPSVPISSFTRLKVLKLLFLIATVKNEYDNDLLDIFDNFYALANGPVESDVYNCITSDSLTFYSFKSFSVTSKLQYSSNDLDTVLKDRLDVSIAKMRSENPYLVSYSAERLVELTHNWAAWQNSIQIAKLLGKGSAKMSTESIRNSNYNYKL